MDSGRNLLFLIENMYFLNVVYWEKKDRVINMYIR